MKRFVPLVAVSLVVCSPICVAQKKVITTPDAISGAPLSPAIQAGNMVFVSGQLAYDPKTKQVKSDAGIEDQTRLALDNIKAILAAWKQPGVMPDARVGYTRFFLDHYRRVCALGASQ